MTCKTQTEDQKTPSPMTKKYPFIRNFLVNETEKRLNEALQLNIKPYFPVAHS